MIDLYYWPTPNGHKITIFLEEARIPYQLHPVNIGAGDQFKPEFLEISPNHKIPAIIDHSPAIQQQPLALFESGAILEYLADKTGKFLPPLGSRDRYEVLQWLYWQIGGLGPMAGQNHHFAVYAPETIPYAIDRYRNETNRLYGVLNHRLHDRPFVAGTEFSIADMAIYPWIVPYEQQGQTLSDFPQLKQWFHSVQDRSAVKKAYKVADSIDRPETLSAEAKSILFGQNAATLDNQRHN
jgi:GST-like protein